MIPTAHLLHGFAGAGKTTFARKLERERGAIRFTIDEWMHTLYGPNPEGDFAELYGRVDGLIWCCATRVLELGCSVIFDYGFWSRASRDQARARLAELGVECIVYNVTCPEDVARERVANRTQHVPGDSLWINDAAFDLFKERLEPLQEDETCVDVDGRFG